VDKSIIEESALRLRAVYDGAAPITPLNEVIPADDVESAYAVQNLNTEYWLGQGRMLTGRKIGLTSHAVQRQMGVDQPDFGMLFSDMAYADDEEVPMSRLYQPKVEGEIAFVLGKDLGSEHLTLIDVISSIDYVLPAIEVVDSRIVDWKIKIMDTIADNASSGLYVLGSVPVRLSDFDHRLCGMVMEHNGEPIATGAGAACLGNPLWSTLWLARKLVEVGRPLIAGDTVLSGALGPMSPAQAGGVYELRISGLGSVRAAFSLK